MNNRDNEVWAHLAVLCLIQKRVFEANQAVSQALRLGIKDPAILKYEDFSSPSPIRATLNIPVFLDPLVQLFSKISNLFQQLSVSGCAWNVILRKRRSRRCS